ncbi:MAG: hypothetical protein AAF514_21815 [Verrucomicrobiota bacterium]
MRKSTSGWWGPIGTLLLCLGCFLVGRLSSSFRQVGSDSGSDLPIRSEAVVGVSAGDEGSGKSSSRLATLQEWLLASGAPDRMVRFQFELGRLSKAELVRLWQFSLGKLNLQDADDYALASAILHQLALKDGALALALADSDGGAWRTQLKSEVVGAWSMIDLEGAIAWIATAGSGAKDSALRSVLDHLGDRDRAQALALFQKLVAGGIAGKRSWKATEFFNEWGAEDPEKAADSAFDHLHFTERTMASRVPCGPGRAGIRRRLWTGFRTIRAASISPRLRRR